MTTAQLELNLLAERSPSPLVLTRPLRRHRRCNQVIRRVNYTRRFFPELDSETIRLGLTRAASGMAVPGGNEVWINPARVSYHTIAHEFVHLLQCRDLGIPQGERSCDVFAMARHWTLNDVAPTYVTLPARLRGFDEHLSTTAARMVYDVAREAIERRRRGLRNYIAFFETRLRQLMASVPPPI